MTKASTSPTAEEARRAIYIDFEGNKDAAPVLLGATYAINKRACSRENLVLEHYVVDETFWPLDAEVPVRCDKMITSYKSSATHLERALRTIIQRAEAQDRLIMSWSTHDQKVAELALDDAERAAFNQRYRNARPVARRWLRETDPTRLPAWSNQGGANKLAHYLNETGYVVPDEFGIGQTGESLRALRTSLEAGKTWTTFTDKQKFRWRDVLGHNMHDCVGMRHVVRHACSVTVGQ